MNSFLLSLIVAGAGGFLIGWVMDALGCSLLAVIVVAFAWGVLCNLLIAR